MSARILHVTTVHPPFDNRIFGMEAASLARAGYDVSLATTVDAPGERDGVTLVPLGALSEVSRRGERLGRNARAFRAMAGPYDIVHVHDPELLIPAGILQRMFGRKIVYDVHEFYDEKFAGGDATADWIPKPLLRAVRGAYGAVERAVLPRAAGVVVVSPEMIARYRRYLPEDRIALVQNFPSLTADDVAAARATEPPMAGPYVVHTGGASKNRTFDVLVATAEKLRELGVNAPIVNIGAIQLESYPHASDLLARSRAAGVVNIGMLSHAETLPWIAHARVGYQPLADSENNRRGAPRKLFEYVLFGLPVVSSDVGNIGDIVRRHDVGLNVPPLDAAVHAAAITTLLEDAALHAWYAENAQAAAPSFSFETQLPNLTALYERILRAPASNASVSSRSPAVSDPVR
jgi:glycosyltransferase involved in cell wall biosynthesis